ncbi:MAG: hypothetical protein WDN76_07745 [Alphaproteobacteria bacterium]
MYRQGEGARVTIVKERFRCSATPIKARRRTQPSARRSLLTPNEQAIVTPVEPVKVAPVDTRQAIAWRHGSPATRLPT